MHLPPRQHRLDRDDAGKANANMRERPWWQPRGEWPPVVHFGDDISLRLRPRVRSGWIADLRTRISRSARAVPARVLNDAQVS
jgi:hypothetical protein